MSDKEFNIIVPVTFEKAGEGEWRVMGLASTSSKDLQGEVIDQNGLDLSPIDMKKGILNWDHKKGPENTIGVIDSYKKSKEGLYLQGRLFKNHSKAKAVHEIMSSLNKADTGRMGMSVEGVIKERAGKDGKVIKKAVIHSCALTMNPVNTDTYASLIKSLSEVEFTEDSNESSEIPASEENTSDQPMFSTNQVLSILEKALAISGGGTMAPDTRTGGDALVQSTMAEAKKKKEDPKEEEKTEKCSDLEKGGPGSGIKGHKTYFKGDEVEHTGNHTVVGGQKFHEFNYLNGHKKGEIGHMLAPEHVEDNANKTKKEWADQQDGFKKLKKSEHEPIAKSLKKLSFELYKSNMFNVLDKLQKLYPEYSRSEIWEAVRDRLETQFPEIKRS